MNALDLDRIWSTQPDHGGNDRISTGDGNDIVIGGEDGELVSDVIIGVASDVARTVAADPSGDGDTIDVGQGNNIVFGDNGRITAAACGCGEFRWLAGDVGVGGDDRVVDRRLRLDHGGCRERHRVRRRRRRHDHGEPRRDVAVDGSDGNNIVIGDNGLIDWTAPRAADCLPGTTPIPSDIDRILTLTPTWWYRLITTGDGRRHRDRRRGRRDRRPTSSSPASSRRPERFSGRCARRWRHGRRRQRPQPRVRRQRRDHGRRRELAELRVTRRSRSSCVDDDRPRRSAAPTRSRPAPATTSSSAASAPTRSRSPAARTSCSATTASSPRPPALGIDSIVPTDPTDRWRRRDHDRPAAPQQHRHRRDGQGRHLDRRRRRPDLRRLRPDSSARSR